MVYFSGFSLKEEQALFSEYLIDTAFSVAGFSYGAQKAFEYVYEAKERVDRLVLISPAYFQETTEAFKKTQLKHFSQNSEAYIEKFLENSISPSQFDLSAYVHAGKKEELEALLFYVWDKEKLKEILDRGTVIEVFLGAKDKIIDSTSALDFFQSETTVYLFKDAGHSLMK